MSDIFADYSFGGWLRRFRLIRGMTLRDIAAELKISTIDYSKLERSETAPPEFKNKIIDMAKAINLSDAETEMLVSSAYNYHLSKFRGSWE